MRSQSDTQFPDTPPPVHWQELPTSPHSVPRLSSSEPLDIKPRNSSKRWEEGMVRYPHWKWDKSPSKATNKRSISPTLSKLSETLPRQGCQTEFTNKLLQELRPQFQAPIEEGKLISRLFPQALLDAADAASHSMATLVVMR